MIEQPSEKITFDSDAPIDLLKEEDRLRDWINNVVSQENKSIERIAYVFLSDEAILEMNKQYLDHNTYTDILTFPYAYKPIETDIYISYDRVKENAVSHDTSEDEEMRRVIIHGVLHMCGWADKSDDDKAAMRQKENECLAIWTKG